MSKSRFTRRELLRAASVLAVPASVPLHLRAGAGPASNGYHYAYVGTYTPNGGGIYLFRIDPATAALEQVQVIDDIRNPTWLAVYDYDSARGGLRLKQVASSLPPKFAGSNLASEVVTTFAVGDDGQLHAVNETWVRSDSPRSLCIDPGGGLLYACNQRGDSITSFHLNAASGALTFTGRFEAVGSPSMMTMLKRS